MVGVCIAACLAPRGVKIESWRNAVGASMSIDFVAAQCLKVRALATPVDAVMAADAHTGEDDGVERTEQFASYMPPLEAQVEGDEPPFGHSTVRRMGGLVVTREVTVTAGEHMDDALVDLAVSGLGGWLAVFAADDDPEARVRLRIWAPPGVEVFLRPPLPVDCRLRL
jgi:hypothetical protein